MFLVKKDQYIRPKDFLLMRRLPLCFSICFCLLWACQDEPTPTSSSTKPITAAKPSLFQLLPVSQTGVDFANRLPETPQLNVIAYAYYYNGGGVAIGDVNHDELPDLYFTGNLVQGKLYLNKGNMQFEDVTQSSGVICKDGWKTGTVMADVNADGHLDIYVCRSGNLQEAQRRNELFINQGDGSFREEAAKYGLDDPGYATQAAFLDYDRDGDLDMYLLNHQIVPASFLGKSLGELRVEVSPFAGDKLFRNEGPGQAFTDVSREAGLISNHIGYGLGIGVGDLNRDGWPDLYVSNDFMEPDYLYLNQKNGTFQEVLKEQIGHTPINSMGNDIADINQDGWPDIVATDMMPVSHFRQKTNMASMSMETFWKRIETGFHYQYMFNTLQLNRGIAQTTTKEGPRFSDIGKLAGISKTDWSWATLFADYDLDGQTDLFISNGMRKEAWNNDFRQEKAKRLQAGQPVQAMIRDLLPSLTSQPISNYMFQNQGDLSFANRSKEWGLNQGGYSNGAAYADLDNDGDLDLVVNNIDGPAFVYQNQVRDMHPERHFLQVRLNGSPKNPLGIGAQLELKANGKTWMKENYVARGYQSSVDPKIHVGLGSVSLIDTLMIVWSDARRQLLTNVAADQVLVLNWEEARQKGIPNRKQTQPLFSDITESADLVYNHQENSFNDYEREILLPHKLSRLGPALAIGDVNGDALEDFYIGGAIGQAGALFLQKKSGKYTRQAGPWTQDKGSEDMAATLFDADGDGDLDLYVVSGGNELALDDPLMQDRLYQNQGKGRFQAWPHALPKMSTSGGCVVAADIDADGDEDLFIGGRQVPGRYPLPAQSHLLRNDGGTFVDAGAEMAPSLEEFGMVSTAVWTDVNGDGSLDLLCTGEWMPITVLIQQDGKFVDQTDTWGLGQSAGWWYSLASADIDADGDMDIVGGNLGLNYKYKASPEKPFQVYGGDFDKNGSHDIVLAYNEGALLYPLRGRECSSQQMPNIQQEFPSFQAFGNASLFDIYGQQTLAEGHHLIAQDFASSWFENKDGRLIRHPLPTLAQISSVHGIEIHDWNGDGHLDLLMAGNLYESEVETPRNDAGMGVLLLGDGKGDFQTISAAESGFYAPGNVKALRSIETPTGRAVLVARNDDQLSLIAKGK